MTDACKCDWCKTNARALADDTLERVYQIAQDLAAMPHGERPPADRVRRAGRRICNLIDQVDETLGLDGEDNG